MFCCYVFLSLWNWALEVPQKEGKKGNLCSGKISSTCLRWKLVDLKRWRGAGGKRGWRKGEREGSLPPAFLWKEKQECRGSHRETRRCPHVNKPCAYWFLTQHGHFQANEWLCYDVIWHLLTWRIKSSRACLSWAIRQLVFTLLLKIMLGDIF